MIHAVNAAAESWFRYMTSAASQATLLALAMLLVVFIGRRMRPALRHALLLVALIKFAIPPALPFKTGLFSWLNPEMPVASPVVSRYVAPIAPVVREALWPAVEPQPTSVPAPAATASAKPQPSTAVAREAVIRHPLSWKAWLMLLHGLGALSLLAMVLWQQLCLRRLVRLAVPAENPDLLKDYNDLCDRMKLRRRPRLLISGGEHAPMTFGVWNRVILLPHGLVSSLTAPEIAVILGHELAHHRRRDPWLNWMQVPIAAAWWFNPIYWLLARAIRSVREDCCDDLVVSSGLASGESYCEILLQAARIASVIGDAPTQSQHLQSISGIIILKTGLKLDFGACFQAPRPARCAWISDDLINRMGIRELAACPPDSRPHPKPSIPRFSPNRQLDMAADCLVLNRAAAPGSGRGGRRAWRGSCRQSG
jgi:beta-lactamase regulating signal transducer with metallopeptidase domain